MNNAIPDLHNETRQAFLVFSVEEMRFAIDIDHIERVERSAAVNALPETGSSVYGLLNYHGEMIPVIHLRHRFSLPLRPLSIHDRMIVLQYRGGQIALAVDTIEKLMYYDDFEAGDKTTASKLHFDELGIDQLTMHEGDASVVYIFDLEKLLNSDDLTTFFNKKEL